MRRGNRRAVQALVVALCGAALLLFAAPGIVSAQLATFQTPTHNIGCYADGGTLRCDIGQKSWTSPSRPASCPLAYGDSFTMRATGKPIWTCHGDTALRMGGVLPYGTTWRSGAFRCTSRSTGLTCTNRAGHGFFLSRQSYRIF